MSPSSPFITADGKIDTDRVLAEAIPIAKLLVLVAAVALVPALLLVSTQAAGASSIFGLALVIVLQFVLAIGAGIVLIHVVTRANELARR